MKTVLFLLGTVGFSYLLNRILLKFSYNFGVQSRQDQKDLVRWSSTTKPTTGGISFYMTFLVGVVVLMTVRPFVAPFAGQMTALFLSATLAFLVGFADDAYGTHPGLKFLGQIGCGAILIFYGVHISFFSLWMAELWWLDYGLTIFWVVGMMNSLNMLDNMDGVTTSIATTILVVSMAMLITIAEGVPSMFYVMIAILGGFVGFLFWNWKPAKIYMGDTGSMFIGMVVAFMGIIYFWNTKSSPDNISHVRRALIPLMVFLVPIMDTTFVTIARISRGSSPFVGGKDHLTHNLARVGIPEPWVPLTLGMVSLISGFLAIFAFRLIPEWTSFYSILFGIYPVSVFALFTVLYRRGTRIGKMKDLIQQREQMREERASRDAREREVLQAQAN